MQTRRVDHMSILMGVLLQLFFTRDVSGHARLLEPPGRSSMWRFGLSDVRNYNDNELNCGGTAHQWGAQEGRCGACGDPWDTAVPRNNERGGKYGLGPTVRNYTQGETIDMGVDVTANHKGWFEIRICPTNDGNIRATPECLNQHVLPLVEAGGGTRFMLPEGNKKFRYRVRLPDNLTCSWCVLQWKYHAGNSWGTGEDGSCVGCGDGQEEFFSCADVAIYPSNQQPTTAPGTRPPAATTTPAEEGSGDIDLVSSKQAETLSPTSVPYEGSGEIESSEEPDETTTLNPKLMEEEGSGEIDVDTTSPVVGSTSAAAGMTTEGPVKCCPLGQWKRVPAMDYWCHLMCGRGFCPQHMCGCGDRCHTNDFPCRPTSVYASVAGMTDWCETNCRAGYCPKTHCVCSGTR